MVSGPFFLLLTSTFLLNGGGSWRALLSPCYQLMFLDGSRSRLGSSPVFLANASFFLLKSAFSLVREAFFLLTSTPSTKKLEIT
ncbi:hypothetical protein [Alkalicoccobacillus gibsonii]|uniref:hypothetical protein n=1 Tax=Alkalicoccobacillus gibsonii TaxID=79881 RepID=UPI003515EA2C